MPQFPCAVRESHAYVSPLRRSSRYVATNSEQADAPGFAGANWSEQSRPT